MLAAPYITTALVYVGAIATAVYLWLDNTPSLWTYLSASAPAGQVEYVLSKLCGLLGVSLLLSQFIIGLSNRLAPKAPAFPHSTRLHAQIGLLTVVIVVLHVLLFILAAKSRGDAHFYLLLLPLWSDDSYRQGLSLGALAVWLLPAVTVGGVLRYFRPPTTTIRYLHRLVGITIFLTILHALRVGSEITLVVFLFLVGLWVLAWLLRPLVR